MRHQISTALAALALLVLAACDKPYTPPPAPRALAPYPAAQSAMPPMLPTAGQETNATATTTGMAGVVESTVRVGLLLPLTGRSAELGRAMQDAATLSLFDKYAGLSLRQGATKVELLPLDTGDTPQQAAAAMQTAIDGGAQFVIGPLFADATEAAASVARGKNIQMLSFSNDVTRGGNGVYMYGFSPTEQVTRVVRFAATAGKARIAALIPDSPYGSMALAAARDALAKQGQALVREVRYAPQGVGIDRAADALVPDGETADFDALLLPESGAALGTILRALNTRGVNTRTVQLLGTGIWDDPALIRRVPLENAWLASSPPAATALFENRFRSTYNYVPPRIASLSYDAVALAVTLATTGRPFDAATLTSDAGFVGPANGVFRLRADGHTERGLAVLQVQAGTFKVISTAPTGFQQ